jgi:hypothetical protein
MGEPLDDSLHMLNYRLARRFDAFFNAGVHDLPWIRQNLEYARAHGAFRMPLPDVGQRTYLVFTPERVHWYFVATPLTDDYLAIVTDGHWQLHHDRYGREKDYVCLVTDEPPYIEGVSVPKLRAVVENVETQINRFMNLYLPSRPLEPPEPKQTNEALPYVIGGVATLIVLLLLCCGLVVAFFQT